MTPIQLIEWRRKYGISQARLASLLDKGRRTVINWERGHTRMPKHFEEMLGAIVAHPAPGSKGKLEPTTVSFATATRLYNLVKGDPVPNEMHPRSLFPDRWSQEESIDLSFLDGMEYKAAVAAYWQEWSRDQEEQRRQALQRALEDRETDPTQPHAPACRCMTCTILKRNGHL